jgi:hypothetical protein
VAVKKDMAVIISDVTAGVGSDTLGLKSAINSDWGIG